jgi:hypothetical protein
MTAIASAHHASVSGQSIPRSFARPYGPRRVRLTKAICVFPTAFGSVRHLVPESPPSVMPSILVSAAVWVGNPVPRDSTPLLPSLPRAGFNGGFWEKLPGS